MPDMTDVWFSVSPQHRLRWALVFSVLQTGVNFKLSRSYVLSQSNLIELLVFVEWAVIMKIVHITEVGFTPPKMLKKNEASEK